MLDICALLKDNNQIKDGPSPTLETGPRGLKNCRCMFNTLMYVWVRPSKKTPCVLRSNLVFERFFIASPRQTQVKFSSFLD